MANLYSYLVFEVCPPPSPSLPFPPSLPSPLLPSPPLLLPSPPPQDVVPEVLLKERLEPDALERVGLVMDSKAFSQKGIKLKTKLL